MRVATYLRKALRGLFQTLHSYSLEISALANVLTCLSVLVAAAALFYQIEANIEQAATDREEIELATALLKHSASTLEATQLQIDTLQEQMKYIKNVSDIESAREENNRLQKTIDTMEFFDEFSDTKLSAAEKLIASAINDSTILENSESKTLYKEVNDGIGSVIDCVDRKICNGYDIFNRICSRTNQFVEKMYDFRKSNDANITEEEFQQDISYEIARAMCFCTTEDSGGTWFWNKFCPDHMRTIKDTAGSGGSTR
jgi:hypothetical protein